MKILLVNSHGGGAVEHYRMMSPNHYLSKLNPEFEFDCVQSIASDTYTVTYKRVWNAELKQSEEITVSPEEQVPMLMDDFVKQYDLVIFCRAIDNFGSSEVTDRLKRLGIPFGVDFDDYWHLPTHHILYKDYIAHRKPEAVIQAIKDATFVTCTTPFLAKEISKYNKNVHIIENGIDHELEEWQPDPIRKQRLRFGFYQGNTHHKNIESCAESIKKVFRDPALKNRFQIILAGFNTYYNDQLESMPSAVRYERLITDDLSVLKDDPFYQQYLSNCIKEGGEQFLNKPYVRIWATSVENFPYTYHFSDVSLIPLIKDGFNQCKSELKLIEAGMKGKGAIVSNVAPYTLLATEKNSYLCTEGRDSFYKRIKRAINNPNEVWDKADQLREDVLAKHSLKVLTEKRKQIYEHYLIHA